MNRCLKIIFFGFFFTIIICTKLQSSISSDKTFLATREHIFNLPIEQTYWHASINRKPNEEYNGTIQSVFFYQKSINQSDLGKYFGFNWGGTRGIENQIGVHTTANTRLFIPREIIHDYSESIAQANRMSANYSFKPYQESSGVRLSYHQDLDKIINGLYFKINSPIVNVKTYLNLHSSVSDISQELPDIPESSVNFIDYLSGKVENVISTHNLQDPLKYAKIDDASHSSSGIADIDIQLGYKSLYKKYIKTTFNISMLIPTGKTPKGEFIFEAIHGNRNHWGIGAGFDFDINLREKGTNLINIIVVGNYKYLFQGIEKRTLDFIEPNPNRTTKEKAGYYKLAGEQGKTKLFPLANVLTQDFKITPGHHFEGIANLAFLFKHFIADIGYNFFIKGCESISLRHSWEDNKYAVADLQYDTANEFSTLVDTTNHYAYEYSWASDSTNVAINNEYLDFDSVRSPSIITHTVYLSLGYQWNKFQYPTMFTIGGSYEFVNGNNALENLAGWIKVGLTW